ncbi:MAG: hypothetical protein KF773_42530 [Deltaproteobacteria bacterium]|nr:hypothetical protein [Deltaproteobacteria bacterium]MCW5806541.1 hypothetical protein [Deltaproteobacteria bacterium]
MLLRKLDERLDLAVGLASLLGDRRDSARVQHSRVEQLR